MCTCGSLPTRETTSRATFNLHEPNPSPHPSYNVENTYPQLFLTLNIAITTARIILHLISYPQFTYDLFHMHYSLTYLSRQHMNPQLTCSQRQWLPSSVGRASHRYREVTGSSPVEVLNFFRLLYAIVKIAITTGEDHSSFDFISAVHI